MSQHVSVLLLGSNIGMKEENIKLALEMLENAGCKILLSTNILQSIPVEFASSNNFCNIATSIIMRFSPCKLLQLIKEIEQNMGECKIVRCLGTLIGL